MNRHLRATTYLATALFTCLLLVGGALAQSPSLTSDKDDYAPGETATLTGVGFQAGETVTLQVLHVDETPDTGEDHDHWTVVAEEDGSFRTTWHVCEDDCIGSTLKATADGQSSGLHAEVLFTDSVTSVTITSPTTGSPVTVTSLPANVTISFTYITSPSGITTGLAEVLGTSASNTKSLTASMSGSDNIVVTIPSGTPNGSYNAKVTVTNTTGTGSNQKNDVQNNAIIVNVPSCTPPSFTSCQTNITVNNDPGQCSASVSFSVVATGIPTPTVECKIGSTVIASPYTFPVGMTTVTCTASNGCGTPATCQFTVTVNDNEKPVITVPADITQSNDAGVCGAVVNFSVSSNDNCDGSVSAVASPASGSSFPVGTTTVTVTASDSKGNSATKTFNVTVNDNENPVFSGCPSDVTVYTGVGATSCSAVASWTAPTASDNCGVTSFTPSHGPGATFPVGTTTVMYTAKDAANNQTTCSFNVTVVDTTPPTIISCPDNVTIAGGASCQATVNVGIPQATDNCEVQTIAGTRDDGKPLTDPYPGPAGVGSKVTTITWQATDKAGNPSTTCSQTVTVTNAAPVIASVIGPTDPLPLSTSVSVSVTVNFTDLESGQGHTCEFSWDDGSPNAIVTGSTGSGTASHTYTPIAAGVYTVQVTVTDACGATSATSQLYIVIYDPSAGFVTGGGWINSPPGAYTPGNSSDPDVVGRANFGFVSKYKKGATTPTGETEFQFQAGNLNFHSTSYQWLVVSGAKAQYKGTGTINNLSGYNFLLTATDGQASGGGGVDKFRIKITGANGVVYDDVPGASEDIDGADPQALGGGSIVIHSTSTKKTSASDLESDEEFIPTEYAIYQNHPNPFNPTTQIQFDLPENSRVKIVIYNMLGRVVKTLLDGEMPAGRYRKLWNGQDQSGQVLPSGIYIYRINAKSASSDRQFNVVKRMVFVK